MWPLVWGRGGDVRRCGPSWGSKGIGSCSSSSFSDRSTGRDCVAHPHGGAPSAILPFPVESRWRTSLLNGYRARRVLDGFGSPRSLHLSRRDIILHPFSPIFFYSFFPAVFSLCLELLVRFSCDCAIRSGLRKDTMAKDSLETSDQFKMVEIRDDRQTRQQKSVEQDREDLARMGKKQVLKVRPKCLRATHVHSTLNRCRGNLA